MSVMKRPAKQLPHNTFRPAGHPKGRHSGDDYGHASGREIFAADDGVVEYVYDGPGTNQGWGRRIIVRHGARATTTYNHMNAGGILVARGERVSAGQHIAQMGNSGTSTGDHLHHEVYIDGVRVDPAPYFSRPLPGTEAAAPAAVGSNVRVVRHPVRRRLEPTSASKNVTPKPLLSAGTVGNFVGFIRGEQVTLNGITTNIWFKGISGNYFWAGNFTSQSTDGLQDLGTWGTPPAAGTPAPKTTPRLELPAYFWYRTARDAERHTNPKGGRYGGGEMLSGPYDVHETSAGGARRVLSKANGWVWVSPQARKYLR